MEVDPFPVTRFPLVPGYPFFGYSFRIGKWRIQFPFLTLIKHVKYNIQIDRENMQKLLKEKGNAPSDAQLELNLSGNPTGRSTPFLSWNV